MNRREMLQQTLGGIVGACLGAPVVQAVAAAPAYTVTPIGPTVLTVPGGTLCYVWNGRLVICGDAGRVWTVEKLTMSAIDDPNDFAPVGTTELKTATETTP